MYVLATSEMLLSSSFSIDDVLNIDTTFIGAKSFRTFIKTTLLKYQVDKE
jgi:hypothetical protein